MVAIPIDTKFRLDKYLSQKFPNYSRAFLKSQIKLGNVLVNNKIKKPSYILKPDDKIEIKISPPKKSFLQPNPNIKLNIIYEDKNIIVIDKIAGISTHPNKPNQNDTIANALLVYYPEIASVGDEPKLRPGIVHRLDKETSGLMVVAKNNAAFDWLKKQLAQRKVVKKYLALVMGNIKENKGIIAKPIGKTKDFRKRTTIPLKKQKEAITHYKVIKYLIENPSTSSGNKILLPEQGGRTAVSKAIQQYSLVEAEPKTGRTHQIRVHLASIGHPIAGDTLYGFKRQAPLLGLKRQFLHAAYLKFSLPGGRMLELKAKLPQDLKQALAALKSKLSMQ